MTARLSTARGGFPRRQGLHLKRVEPVAGRADAQRVVHEPVTSGQREAFELFRNDADKGMGPPARRARGEMSGVTEGFVRDPDRGTGPEHRFQTQGPMPQNGGIGHKCSRPKMTASMISV